jgi:SAM-dependent methyltransferase
MPPSDYSFIRYLAAKKIVDDRALNRRVWDRLVASLPAGGPLRVLEVGAGIGTMLERMLTWGILTDAHYTAVDSQPEHLAHACQRLSCWGAGQGFRVVETAEGLLLSRGKQQVAVVFEVDDLFQFTARQAGRQAWDLLVAHAFLDLLDVPAALPQLFRLANETGLFYFTLNFDGATLLEPAIDPPLDDWIECLYHRSMDERLAGGEPSGDSRTGRRLFAHLNAAGARLIDAGSSDWVVFAGESGYTEEEAYFLHFIIHTIHQALRGHPELDPARFAAWIARRHEQVERGELVYIAHQLDFLGRYLHSA